MIGKRRGYEVHEHSYISGPNARWAGRRLHHSHVGGDRPHQHEHTGPAAYTIDKDEWLAATGMRGGGRKRFTATPTDTMAAIDLEPHQIDYDIIIVGPPSTTDSGPGLAVPARLDLAHGLKVRRVEVQP